MKLKCSLLIICAVLCFVGCYDEDKLTSTPGTEEIFPLPQGNHDYDRRIVEWFEKYGFYALYKFEGKDLYWSNTTWDEFDTHFGTGNLLGQIGDTLYVGTALDLFQEFFLDCYPDDMLTENMPLRVLLNSELYYCYSQTKYVDGEWVTTKHYDPIWAYSGWDNVAVNGASKYAADSMQRSDKLNYSKDVNAVFLKILGQKNVITVSDDFFKVSAYDSKLFYGVNLFANGYLRTDSKVAIVDIYKMNDLLDFLKLVAYPMEILEGEAIPESEFESGTRTKTPPLEGLFSRPESALCKQKYEILVRCLKEAGINMDKIQYPLN